MLAVVKVTSPSTQPSPLIGSRNVVESPAEVCREAIAALAAVQVSIHFKGFLLNF